MKKTLLQEVKEMNRIAGTQMTKEQEIKLIKERLEELNEMPVVFTSGGGINSDLPLILRLVGGVIALGLTATLGAAGLYTADLVKKAKDAFSVWKRGGELKPNVVKGIVDDFKKKIQNSKFSKGQKAYLTRYVNKLEKADPSDKRALRDAEDALKRVAKQWQLSENKKNK